VIRILLHDGLAFVDDSADAFAVLVSRLFIEALGDPCSQAVNLPLRLFERSFERLRSGEAEAAFAGFASALVSCRSPS
jgi:hypothetical protein